MFGKEALRSFIVYSRTKTELLGYDCGLVATSQRGSVSTPVSSWKGQANYLCSFLLNWETKNKIKQDYDTVPDKTNAEAPGHVIWTQAYEKYRSRQQISHFQLPRNMSDRTDCRTLSPVVNKKDIQSKYIKWYMQEWKEHCYEWKIKYIINKKTESASKVRNPQKQENLYSSVTVCRKKNKFRSTKTTPETSSASPTTGSGLSQQYSFLCAEMPTWLNP